MNNCVCGKMLNMEGSSYIAYDLQRGYEKLEFCSIKCREDWMRQKRIGMWISLVLGIALSIVLLIDGNAVLAIQGPYRRWGRVLELLRGAFV